MNFDLSQIRFIQNTKDHLEVNDLSFLVQLGKLIENKNDKEKLILSAKSLIQDLLFLGKLLEIKGYDYDIKEDENSLEGAFILAYESLLNLIQNKSKIRYYQALYSLCSVFIKLNLSIDDLK